MTINYLTSQSNEAHPFHFFFIIKKMNKEKKTNLNLFI